MQTNEVRFEHLLIEMDGLIQVVREIRDNFEDIMNFVLDDKEIWNLFLAMTPVTATAHEIQERLKELSDVRDHR
jgi:hypothetical protein